MDKLTTKIIHTQKCPACKSCVNRFIYKLNYGEVVKCEICDLVYTQFNNIETFRNANKTWSNTDSIKSALYSLPITRNNMKYRVDLINRFSNGKRLIEFGSNTGEFLYEAYNSGYDLTAVDHCFAILMLNKTPGLKYIIADASLSSINEKYDVVVACHILEHMESPEVFILKSKQILNSNGILFLEVPNYDSFTRRIEGKRWHMFYEYHISHFTTSSLISLLEKNGFKIKFVRTLQPSEYFINKTYSFLKHSLWSLIKKTLPINKITIQERNNNSFNDNDSFINSLEEEKRILNSLRGRMYRLEIKIRKFISLIFAPFSWIINIFQKGEVLAIIAES